MTLLSFSSASKTLDLFKRPDHSDSSSEDEPLSPAAKIQAILKQNPFAGGLPRADRAELKGALNEFAAEYCDSPRARLRACKVNETLEVAAAQFTVKPPTPAFHRKAFEALNGCAWGLDLIARLKKFPVRYPTGQEPSQLFPLVINMDHIVRGEVNERGTTLGLHFSPPNSATRALLRDICRNPQTGVFCATVQLNGGTSKFSTFFPDAVQTEEELIELIGSADLLLTGKDDSTRLLMLTKGVEPAFCFEVTLTREGQRQLITAAYPVFDYCVFQVGQTYQITADGVITSGQVLSRLANLSEDTLDKLCKYEYQTPTVEGPAARKVLDIAPLFPELGIAKGIYIDIEADFSVFYGPETELAARNLTEMIQSASEQLSATIHQVNNAVSGLYASMAQLQDSFPFY